MIYVAFIVSIVSFAIALDNYNSIKELRYHYSKLYLNDVYGKSVREEYADTHSVIYHENNI